MESAKDGETRPEAEKRDSEKLRSAKPSSEEAEARMPFAYWSRAEAERSTESVAPMAL